MLAQNKPEVRVIVRHEPDLQRQAQALLRLLAARPSGQNQDGEAVSQRGESFTKPGGNKDGDC